MSQTSKMRCIVRNCGNLTGNSKDLCNRCFHMLICGELNRKSTAWFVTELVFMEKQNDAAMTQVKYLHDKVNEICRDRS